mgnify:FL=1
MAYLERSRGKSVMRIPEQATLCEKIGGTEYTVTAHFREDGRDLLGLLSRIFMRDTADYSFDSEGYDLSLIHI